jgi:hypothetical protein
MIHTMVMLAAPVLLTAVDDPIKYQLDQARAVYNERLDKVRAKFLEAVAKKSDETAKRGDLKGVKVIEAGRDLFESDGTLPKAPQLSAVATTYKAELKTTTDAFLKTLRKARDDYTKAKKIEQADEIQAELDQFEMDQVAAKKQSQSTVVNRKEPFQEGTRWTGTRYPSVGAAQRWEMTIASRKINKVSGRIAIKRVDGKTTSYLFQGTAKGLRIEFVTEKLGGFQQHFAGKYNGNEVVFDWDGMTDKGYRDSGTAKLEQQLK